MIVDVPCEHCGRLWPFFVDPPDYASDTKCMILPEFDDFRCCGKNSVPGARQVLSSPGAKRREE